MGDTNEQKSETPKITGEKQEERDEKGRFIEGVSGNPKGRPEGSISITTEIKKKLGQVPKGEQKTYLEIFLTKILNKAMVEEDQQMMKLIWNYIDGMPKQNIGLGIDDTIESIEFKVTRNKNENKSRHNNGSGEERERISERNEDSNK